MIRNIFLVRDRAMVVLLAKTGIRAGDTIVIDAIRGYKAFKKRTFCANQMPSFKEIRREYERTVPKFVI